MDRRTEHHGVVSVFGEGQHRERNVVLEGRTDARGADRLAGERVRRDRRRVDLPAIDTNVGFALHPIGVLDDTRPLIGEGVARDHGTVAGLEGELSLADIGVACGERHCDQHDTEVHDHAAVGATD